MQLIKLWSWFLPFVLVSVVVVNVCLLSYLHGTKLSVRLSGCDIPSLESVDNNVEVVTLQRNTSKELHEHNVAPSKLEVIGTRRPNKGFLTVGVPSIRRINGPAYLLETLASLSEHTTKSEKSEVTIVVFLADFDAEYNNETIAAIVNRHRDDLALGFMNIIRVSSAYYPQLNDLKRNYGDAPDRVQWRAKQVIDFTLLFQYSANISEYYVQLEDDVRAAKGFVRSIRQYVRERSRISPEWTALEFSELGFIGKLFRSSDLGRLVRFMMAFYIEQPIDWLVRYFKLAMNQQRTFLRKPTVFQHFGVKSSFDVSKDNPLKDRFFDPGDGPFSSADNPSAIIMSTMAHYQDFTPEMAYSSGTGYFWATKVVVGDSLQIVFDATQNLSRIVVKTGNKDHPKDILHSGSLSVGATATAEGEKFISCDSTKLLASFENGAVVADNLETVLSFRVRCVKVTVEESHNHWVVFANIAVFVHR